MADQTPESVTYDSAPDTLAHIARVGDFMALAIQNLVSRAARHDASKLCQPEKAVFDEATPKLANLVYGTDEYRASVRALGPALKHHQEANDHHPEHFPNGVAGMSLLSLLEMLCDWRAASERTKQRADGDEYLKRSFDEGLAYNQQRWEYGDELAGILRNTAVELGLVEP